MLKDSDELDADDFSFLLGISDPFERLQESLAGIDIFQANAEILAEHALDNFFFACAQEAVVHKNAGELVPDRFVQERGCDRRIDAAAQAEHDFFIAYLLSNPLARFFDERAHCPIHRTMADVVDEVLQDLFTARRMRDLRMKLQTVKLPLSIFHGGEVGTVGSTGGEKTFWQRSHFVTVAVPDVD